jgi:acyl-CoA reductase-like NAD-dependent aldehyde dehydrogenase
LSSVDSGSRAPLLVRSPYTDEIVGEVPSAEPRDVDQLLRSMSHGDGCLPTTERHDVLQAAATRLAAASSTFVQLIVSEAGICRNEAEREVQRAVENLRVAAGEAERLTGECIPVPSRSGTSRRIALTLREPVGTVAALTPFNRPLNQVVVKVAPALAAGNQVVVKPSEKAPLSAFAFADLLHDIGVPKTAVAIVAGHPEAVGGTLCSSPSTDMVTFTGSVTTGRTVARAAAGKKLLLELGGNDPLILLDDGDPVFAAELTVRGAFGTAGQSCRGIKRVIVSDSVADDFVAALVPRVEKLVCGDPALGETDLGPLIDPAAAELVERRCADAIAQGAVQLVGEPRSGALVPPIVLDHVAPDTQLVAEETFGPVAPIIRVADVEEAISVSNSTPYGLQAGIVTANVARFTYVASRLRVGGVNLLEGPQFDSPFIPFGGVKASGIGREGIRFAMREMSVVKTITLPW